jgi:hypothetical protein
MGDGGSGSILHVRFLQLPILTKTYYSISPVNLQFDPEQTATQGFLLEFISDKYSEQPKKSIPIYTG